MKYANPINFKNWLKAHENKLKPPVCNQVLWQDEDYIVMVVGGPNARSDFHVNPGGEIFYQVQGEMTLRLCDSDDGFQDVIIQEGDMFFLPQNTPHLPIRAANTVGIVVEKNRQPQDLDGFIWYCEQCHSTLFSRYEHIADIVKQLPEIFSDYFSQPENQRCQKCGHVNSGKTN